MILFLAFIVTISLFVGTVFRLVDEQEIGFAECLLLAALLLVGSITAALVKSHDYAQMEQKTPVVSCMEHLLAPQKPLGIPE